MRIPTPIPAAQPCTQQAVCCCFRCQARRALAVRVAAVAAPEKTTMAPQYVKEPGQVGAAHVPPQAPLHAKAGQSDVNFTSKPPKTVPAPPALPGGQLRQTPCFRQVAASLRQHRRMPAVCAGRGHLPGNRRVHVLRRPAHRRHPGPGRRLALLSLLQGEDPVGPLSCTAVLPACGTRHAAGRCVCTMQQKPPATAVDLKAAILRAASQPATLRGTILRITGHSPTPAAAHQ